MKKILMIYGSTMGNTEQLAELITSELKNKDVEIKTKNVKGLDISILSNYDIVLFGSSTWGDGELQDDFAEFLPQLQFYSLKGKKVAVFGPGDSNYDKFCEAVNIVEETVIKCGAEQLVESLKVDGEIDDSIELITEWSQQLANSLINET
jgi:flavodoxin I